MYPRDGIGIGGEASRLANGRNPEMAMMTGAPPRERVIVESSINMLPNGPAPTTTAQYRAGYTCGTSLGCVLVDLGAYGIHEFSDSNGEWLAGPMLDFQHYHLRDYSGFPKAAMTQGTGRVA